MRHICYTLATLCFPTLSSHHLRIKNAPHLSHFGYTFHSHTTCTLLLHFLSHTLTTQFANQKCATFVTLWLHFAFPHLDYTFGGPKMRHICYTLATLCFPTLSPHHLLIKNAPHLLHSPYTLLSHTLTTLLANQKCATFVTLWPHFAFPHFHPTIC
jgi:hypothetical protein